MLIELCAHVAEHHWLSPCSGTTGYKACYQEVLQVVKGVIHQPLGLKGDSVFYAFSYYYDRAVDAGLIGEETLTHSPFFIITHLRLHQTLPVSASVTDPSASLGEADWSYYCFNS